ncbi:WD40/YVTN/BNR-like repeat-containing protein [Bacteroidota bacterium]
MRTYLIVLIFNFSMGYLLFNEANNKYDYSPSTEEIPMVTGKEDDPEARLEQEFLMLRDPATNKIPRNIFTLEREFARNLPKRIQSDEDISSGLNKVTALTWTARGPNNVGGRTRALGIDKRTDTPPNVTILAGGVSGGIWRSTNDGSSWTSVTSVDQLKSITCLTQDMRSGKNDYWYAGTGEASGNSASGSSVSTFRGDGIFKSTDNGLT